MQNLISLDQCGADISSYFFTEKEIQSLPKTCSERKFVTKLPSAFTKYYYEEDKRYPNKEENIFSGYDISHLENAIFLQAEKFLCDGKQKNFKMIYNQKLNQKNLIQELQNLGRGQVEGFPQYIPDNPSDQTLGFESRFECGNLQTVMKVQDDDYELYTSPDVSNEKYTNWFFFRVYNTRKGKTYKFTINNMSKTKSLFNQGGRILMYSKKKDKFYRVGKKIVFFCNFIKKKNNTNCYSMFFEVQFPEDFDSVYISLNYPYTYSRVKSLQYYLFNTIKQNFIKSFVIGKTLNDNLIEGLSLKLPGEQKKAIVIGARVHPGETISSYVMEKVIQILSDKKNQLGQELLKKYDFYIIPMINIDGVVLGNYRTNKSGYDLNRTYHDPSMINCPTTYAYKHFIKDLQEKQQIYFFLDIHCHSKKFDCFIYANPPYYGEQNIYLNLMEKNIPFFSRKDCLELIRKEKEKSARVVIWKEVQVEHSYTLEMSYAGVTKGQWDKSHHSQYTYKTMAEGILKSLNELEDAEKEQLKQRMLKFQNHQPLIVSEQKKDQDSSEDSDDQK